VEELFFSHKGGAGESNSGVDAGDGNRISKYLSKFLYIYPKARQISENLGGEVLWRGNFSVIKRNLVSFSRITTGNFPFKELPPLCIIAGNLACI
jgi:hypothetical protein